MSCSLAITLAAPATASAAPDTATSRLCGGRMACSIQVNSPLRPAMYTEVLVTGRPGARISVQAHLVRFTDGNEFDHLERYGKPEDVVVGRNGTATARLLLEALKPSQQASPWLFIGPPDVDQKRFAVHVGAFVPFGSMRPQVLGDGFASEKPVGVPLNLHFTGALEHSFYWVEWRDGAGVWRRVNRPHSKAYDWGESAPDPQSVSVLPYTVPRGLSNSPQKFRLQSVGDGQTVATWQVIPSENPERRTYLPLWEPPTTRGGRIGVSKRNSSHVSAVSTGVAGSAGALGLALVWASSLRHRPLRRPQRAAR